MLTVSPMLPIRPPRSLRTPTIETPVACPVVAKTAADDRRRLGPDAGREALRGHGRQGRPDAEPEEDGETRKTRFAASELELEERDPAHARRQEVDASRPACGRIGR